MDIAPTVADILGFEMPQADGVSRAKVDETGHVVVK